MTHRQRTTIERDIREHFAVLRIAATAGISGMFTIHALDQLKHLYGKIGG